MSRFRTAFVSTIALMAALAALAAPPAFATNTPDDDDSEVGEVVITGSMRVRQGGAQDIGHFRGEVERKQIPFPDTITPEGLMGGYDIRIGAAQACDQLFCLTGETMRAGLTGKPDDKLFVGLGFNTNLDADAWQREPLNLVAVVDKSGSMDGQPLDLVRKSLRQIVGQLRPGDQVSVVLYGDEAHVYMEPTMVTAASRGRILSKIDGIESAGSTYMEAGLRVGYDTAFATAPAFKGKTRLMLFTDEQPNVGATDAESFMGMAREASRRGVGLTTIGVGVQFDGPLATQVSSVRGGNLYFINDEAEVKAVFSAKLDTMVSELAHDLRMEMKPHPGYRISAVYGVPGEVMSQLPEGAVAITVPTAFLSTEGGGIFVTLARTDGGAFLPEPSLAADARLMDVGLSYVVAADGKAMTDALSVAPRAATPGDGLTLAHALVDEFLGLREGAALFHKGDEEAAYQTFRALSARLRANPDPRLKPEREMVAVLLNQSAYLAGATGELPADGSIPKGVRGMALIGEWEVVRIDGEIDLRRGDKLIFDEEDYAEIDRLRGPRADDEPELYKVSDRQILLTESGVAFDYRMTQDSLTLSDRRSGVRVALRRVAEQQ